ncbi:hypothetical protein [Peptoniphilus stercorisuis]|uniref:Transcriptional regulator n=1 Tax=Peptoniphilus stercorisuis TaxID=1436965 RepID=A0ABS4KC02_9FIRM|nr:hypothetical protein [Peptoniphilus stercorisuis]MBP2025300.1 hypothetical protein [Peptoniphilus stercorisuis]
MNIGIIGADDSVDKIIELVEKEYEDINFISFRHNEIENIDEIFSEIPQDIDGIFATGIGVYNKLQSFNFNCPISYAKHGSIGLLKTFFDVYNENLDLKNKNISFDIIDEQSVSDIIKEFDIPINNYYVPCPDNYKSESFYLENHLKLYRDKKVDYIFTSFGYIYSLLKNLNIPVYRIYPSNIDIKSNIDSLIRNINLVKLNKKSLLVYKFNISSKENKSYIKSILTEYANLIEGLITEYSDNSLIIISNKNFYNEIDCLYLIYAFLNKKNISNILVGLGTGTTLTKAIDNAEIAIENTSSSDWLYFYDGNVLKKYDQYNTNYKTKYLSDEKIQNISEKTGIKTKHIQIIDLSIVNLNRNIFTSSELSDLLGLTVRSANRIMNTLVKNNFAEFIDNSSFNESIGRPKRQIKINF